MCIYGDAFAQKENIKQIKIEFIIICIELHKKNLPFSKMFPQGYAVGYIAIWVNRNQARFGSAFHDIMQK